MNFDIAGIIGLEITIATNMKIDKDRHDLTRGQTERSAAFFAPLLKQRFFLFRHKEVEKFTDGTK